MIKGTLFEWLPYQLPNKLLGFSTQYGDNLTCQQYYRYEMERFKKAGRKAELKRYNGLISLWIDRLA